MAKILWTPGNHGGKRHIVTNILETLFLSFCGLQYIYICMYIYVRINIDNQLDKYTPTYIFVYAYIYMFNRDGRIILVDGLPCFVDQPIDQQRYPKWSSNVAIENPPLTCFYFFLIDDCPIL
jgi:hypothetical protein